MSSLLKLERDRLLAEAHSLESIIEDLDSEDIMSKIGLQDRLAEIREEIYALEIPYDRNASLALFFSGAPVIGQRGIESEFASQAVGRFQDLVSKIMADELSGLGERGPIPARATSTMHITNIVRGSFGFLLEEMNDQGEMVETALERAVEGAGKLLMAYSGENEEEFQIALGDTNGRIANAARDIFQLLSANDATLRLLTSQIDHSFYKADLDIALDRALSSNVEETVVSLNGVIAGLLPEGHMFEFRSNDETIRGKISREVEAGEIVVWNQRFLGNEVRARFLKTAVFRDGEIARHSFKLLGIDETLNRLRIK